MGPYLMQFQIRDLEQFTGVKAHTIRVWERRYGLLKPDRTDTNIRTYDLDELKTILNVAYLNQKGHKISRIAAMTPAELDSAVRQAAMEDQAPIGILNTLVMAMLSFDESLFEGTCDAYVEQHGFRPLVEQVLVKLLERIGLLWQSNAICPAQEHFRSAGRRTIYLGQSVPSNDLLQVASLYTGSIRFVTLLVVRPSPDDAPEYLRALRASLPDPRITFLAAGMPLRGIEASAVPDGMQLFPDLASLIAAVAPLR